MKEKSTVYKSDLMEMYDRAKMCRLDMLDFATRNGVEINLRIDAKGQTTMQIVEHTKDKLYFKELVQTEKVFKYQEIENKK